MHKVYFDDDDYKKVIRLKKILGTSFEIKKFTNSNTYYVAMRYTSSKKRYFVYIHRFVLGVTDKNIHVDHVDNNGLNNQRSNIRECDRFQNMKNRSSAKNSSSKYLGVHFSKWHGKFRAVIKPSNKKNKHLGYFEEEKDAAIAYNEAATGIHGEFANLNSF